MKIDDQIMETFNGHSVLSFRGRILCLQGNNYDITIGCVTFRSQRDDADRNRLFFFFAHGIQSLPLVLCLSNERGSRFVVPRHGGCRWGYSSCMGIK